MSRQRTTVYKRYRIFLVNFPMASIASAPATDLLDLALTDHVVGLQRDPAHEVGSANRIVVGIKPLVTHRGAPVVRERANAGVLRSRPRYAATFRSMKRIDHAEPAIEHV